MKRSMLLIVWLLFLSSYTAMAIDLEQPLDDPALQARYEAIIGEVRCLQCQNQTIKDSNADLATDLRRVIRRLLEEGKTDEEIYDFLVARYGDFVLYRPRTSGRTLILWIAPMIFLVFGGFALMRVVRRRMSLPIDDDSVGEA
ncbi:MAG: cytochrome c-type biogenesis protein [Woeseiaceae bacterium]